MYLEDFEKLAKDNNNFRKVLYTGKYSQLVAMSIPLNEEIGEEIHTETDQLLFFVEGDCEGIIDGVRARIDEGEVVFVPAGTKHNFINKDDEDLKILTIYSPPHHPENTIHRTKQEAQGGEGI